MNEVDLLRLKNVTNVRYNALLLAPYVQLLCGDGRNTLVFLENRNVRNIEIWYAGLEDLLICYKLHMDFVVSLCPILLKVRVKIKLARRNGIRITWKVLLP